MLSHKKILGMVSVIVVSLVKTYLPLGLINDVLQVTVSVLDFEWLSDVEWAIYLRQSYELVKGKLPIKNQESP